MINTKEKLQTIISHEMKPAFTCTLICTILIWHFINKKEDRIPQGANHVSWWYSKESWMRGRLNKGCPNTWRKVRCKACDLIRVQLGKFNSFRNYLTVVVVHMEQVITFSLIISTQQRAAKRLHFSLGFTKEKNPLGNDDLQWILPPGGTTN